LGKNPMGRSQCRGPFGGIYSLRWFPDAWKHQQPKLIEAKANESESKYKKKGGLSLLPPLLHFPEKAQKIASRYESDAAFLPWNLDAPMFESVLLHPVVDGADTARD
jgi:hypothetical protein